MWAINELAPPMPTFNESRIPDISWNCYGFDVGRHFVNLAVTWTADETGINFHGG